MPCLRVDLVMDDSAVTKSFVDTKASQGQKSRSTIDEHKERTILQGFRIAQCNFIFASVFCNVYSFIIYGAFIKARLIRMISRGDSTDPAQH